MALQKPHVMGVLNVTPDSFSDGGEFESIELQLAHVKLMLSQGATIIDVGGESTRPGATRVSLEQEQQRVLPIITALKKADWFQQSGALISIDTMNSETARLAIKAGVDIVNDVSGGLADPRMFSQIANSKVLYVMGHWRGFSDQMDELNAYEDIAKDVVAELSEQIAIAKATGVRLEQIIVDPGLGFAKDQRQNWQLVARLDELEKLGLPILVGASRKRFIASALDNDEPGTVTNARRDLATAVLTALLLQRKLWGVRVHNVQATTDAIALVNALRLAEQNNPRES